MRLLQEQLDQLEALGFGPEKVSKLLDFVVELMLQPQCQNEESQQTTRDSETMHDLEVEKLLNEIGVPYRLSGREYVAEAVLYVIKNGRAGVTLTLYPYIGRKYEVSQACVERSIRTVIDVVFKTYNEKVQEIFSTTTNNQTGKVSNSEFIYGLVSYLQVKMR